MDIEISKADSYYNIRIPIRESYHDKYLRKFLDYLRVKKICSKSPANDDVVEKLSEEIMTQWWNENKNILRQ